MRPHRDVGGRWVRERASGVTCPACGAGRVLVRCGCLATTFGCTDCAAVFELSELARRLDEERFAILVELIGHRLSDRV